MKLMRISLLLLILFAAIAGGCKIAQEVTDGEPGTLLGKGLPETSEQELSSGLEEIDEIEKLELDELDGSLDELEQMNWE